MKYSKQRTLILETVVSNPIHPTANQVYEQLHCDNPNISLGTVYRNLNLLSELGQLKKIKVPDSSDRFDGRTERHCHIICNNCGRVSDADIDGIEALERQTEEKTGYSVDKLEIVFEGLCPDCKNSEKSKINA